MPGKLPLTLTVTAPAAVKVVAALTGAVAAVRLPPKLPMPKVAVPAAAPSVRLVTLKLVPGAPATLRVAVLATE